MIERYLGAFRNRFARVHVFPVALLQASATSAVAFFLRLRTCGIKKPARSGRLLLFF